MRRAPPSRLKRKPFSLPLLLWPMLASCPVRSHLPDKSRFDFEAGYAIKVHWFASRTDPRAYRRRRRERAAFGAIPSPLDHDALVILPVVWPLCRWCDGRRRDRRKADRCEFCGGKGYEVLLLGNLDYGVPRSLLRLERDWRAAWSSATAPVDDPTVRSWERRWTSGWSDLDLRIAMAQSVV